MAKGAAIFRRECTYIFFKKCFDNREKSKNLTKIASFSFEKKSRKGGQSGKNPTIGGDLYDQGGSKNRGFHNGRNFGGHILTEHPVLGVLKNWLFLNCRVNFLSNNSAESF